MRMQIDEAWRDDEAVGIDDLLGKAGGAPAQLRDFAVLDPDVAAIARTSGTVNDRAAFDLNVVISHRVFPPRESSRSIRNSASKKLRRLYTCTFCNKDPPACTSAISSSLVSI